MYPFPAPNDDYDCTTCKSKVGAIFQELLKPKAQEVFVAEIQRDLNCDTDPDMADDILCSDNADKIVLFLGQEVAFSQAEAKDVCETEDGACQKAWTKASCADDLKDIVYPRLLNFDGQAHLVEIAMNKYSALGEMKKTEDETQWKKDIHKMVNILDELFESMGPGILCDLVDHDHDDHDHDDHDHDDHDH